jgi:hypothetical protein
MGFKTKLKKIKTSLGCVFGTSKRRKGSLSEEDDSKNYHNRSTVEHTLSPRLSCIARDEELVAYIEDEPSIEISPRAAAIQSKPSSVAFDRNRSQMTPSTHPASATDQLQQSEGSKVNTNTLVPPPVFSPVLSPASSSYSYMSNITEPLSIIKVKPSTEEKSRHIRTSSINMISLAHQEEPFQFGSYNKLLSPASDAMTLEDEVDPLRLITPSHGNMGGFFTLTSPLSLVFGSRSDSQQLKSGNTDHEETSQTEQMMDTNQDEEDFSKQTSSLRPKESVIDAPSDEQTLSPPAPTPAEENNENTRPLPKKNGRMKSIRMLYGSAKSSSNLIGTEQESQSQTNDKALQLTQQHDISPPSDPKEKKKRKKQVSIRLLKKRTSSGGSPLQPKDTNSTTSLTSEKEAAPKRDASFTDDAEEVKKLKVDEAPELVSESEELLKTIRYDAWKDYQSEAASFGDTHIMGTHGKDPLTAPRVLSPPLMESLQMFLPFACTEDNLWLKFSLVRDVSAKCHGSVFCL